MNEESSIVAWADVVINEDFRINSVRLVLEEDNTFSLLMPAYKPRGKEDFIPLVEMDAGVEHELTRFLVQNLDTTKAVEVVGGGTPSTSVRRKWSCTRFIIVEVSLHMRTWKTI